MEIKLNKDLQTMQDNVFMGLNARQTVCAGAGVVLGAAAYFLCSRYGINTEAASWICIVIAAPFAALGFITKNGMPFEQIVKVSRLENYDYALDKADIEAAREKEAHRRD